MRDAQNDSERRTWAEETFGHAQLGDARRVQRLIAMADTAASRPAGTVTGVFTGSAEREGAFRFLESEHVEAAQVASAVFTATARQCAQQPYVFVAVDGTSLTLTDRPQRRELGRVGSSHKPTRGLHLMNSLAVDTEGAPIGLLDQVAWAREQPPPKKKKNKKRKKRKSNRGDFRQKETRHWVDSLVRVQELLANEAPDVQPWFQLDRGADCWPVIQTAVERSMLVTIRAVHNRRLSPASGRTPYLHDRLQRQPVLGRYELEVPAKPGREARIATMSVRACTVTLDLHVSRKRHAQVTLQAVLAQEVGGPGGKARLRWLLLTTHPVTTFEQASAVIDGYTKRWRVEEFHRAWKRGVCNVEDTQLHSREAILKWATILAAVATRAVRLAYLARTTPEVLASAEYSPHEIDAAFILTKRKRDRRRKVTLREMTDMVAEQGGFAGKYSGRPPGPTVIARGLLRIAALAEGLQNMEEM
jgi:hypothetical protein